MLTVVIESEGDEEALTRTLAPLVTGSVAGVVREVIICDRSGNESMRQIADLTGCHYVSGEPLAKALAASRSDWILLLEPGARLLEGWTDAVIDHVNAHTRAARFTRSRRNEASSWWSWLKPTRRRLVDGLLIRRSEAVALAAGVTSSEQIARGVSPARLSAEILFRPSGA
jgi:hypothetical protein